MSDITVVKNMLQSRAREVAQHLLPAGKLVAREWCAGSIGGERGESLKVCVSGAKAGVWADFAEGSGGDLIDLWRLARGIALPQALDDIRAWLGVEKPQFERQERVWNRPKKLSCEAPKNEVFFYLAEERRISQGAMEAYKIAQKDRRIILPFLTPDGTLAMVKYRSIDRLPNGKADTRPMDEGCEPILFGWQAIPPNAREVTITEGELDALSMWDYGYPAMSVPFGGGKGAKQQWIESEFDRMQRFETIYLALDMDKEGDAAAEEIANRLGRHRCRRVNLPKKDANDCAQSSIRQDVIAACIASATSLDPPELRRASEFTDEVMRLFYPLEGERVGYKLPFSKLDGKVEFRPSELTIWTGATGMGKSQLLSHASMAWGDSGARVCIASLEMRPAQLLKRMVKQAGNIDRPTQPFLRQIMAWLNEWVWIFDVTGKSRVTRMIEIFEYARARYFCDVFVVDSLMRLGVGSEDYEAQEKAIFEMVNWAVEKGVHIHLVAHSRKGDRHAGNEVPEVEDIKGASEIGANAFNVITVWRNRKLEDELKMLGEQADRGDIQAGSKLRDLQDKPTVVMNLAKQRNGDWEGKTGLWFDQKSYQYRCFTDNRSGHQYVHYDQGADDNREAAE